MISAAFLVFVSHIHVFQALHGLFTQPVGDHSLVTQHQYLAQGSHMQAVGIEPLTLRSAPEPQSHKVTRVIGWLVFRTGCDLLGSCVTGVPVIVSE